jgi:hypothetical protein
MSLRNIQVIPELPYNVKPIIDITDTLPSRTPDTEPYRSPEQITHISVHHSAVEGATIQSYANYHVNTLGWNHIGYHTVVKGDQIYQTNDLLTFSYHTSSNNAYTVAVSVSGDLSKRGLTDDERNCLYATILTYMGIFNIPVQNVLGHREYPANNTSCPCLDMNKLRSDIAQLQLQMKAVADPSQIKVNAYKATEQHRYLYNQYIGDPNANKWLEPYLLKMDEVTRDMGMYFGK